MTREIFKMAVVLRRFFFLKTKSRFPDLTSLTIQPRVDILHQSTSSQVVTESSEESERNLTFVNEIDGFKVLHLYPKYQRRRRTERRIKPTNPPRTTLMSPEHDWTDAWPGPKTFHPASVPLPVRQGCNKFGPPPEKFANTELMKIPNFLHLTPPAIEKHCKAIQKFCTEWPKGLETDEDIEKHFPVEIITSDYCHSSCSIRDPKSRIVSLKIKLSNLEFDKHAKDKFLRVVGPRYDPSTDYVTITTDSCPLKKQNYDYANYLLTAVYFESWKHEAWEKEKSDDDMEEYIFSERQCFRNVKSVFDYNERKVPSTQEYGKVVEKWINNGDDRTTIEKYKEHVMKLLSLPSLEVQT